MSHVGRISTVGAGAPSARRPALSTLALIIPLVLVVAVAIVLAATGPGASSSGSPTAGKFSPPSLPDLRTAPTRGSASVVPSR